MGGSGSRDWRLLDLGRSPEYGAGAIPRVGFSVGASDAAASGAHPNGQARAPSWRLRCKRKRTPELVFHVAERQLRGVWFDHRAADRLRDEAPGAYKDIESVMRAQRDLTRVRTRLRPVLVYKAG